ncbi:MAG: hypothetical protein RBU31_08970 [Syntrophales bacterium]|jgi:hypothetical protein|nr:hypothetical protein [Syntrophales bacterium]
MTISTYQVDNVIKAYNRQSRQSVPSAGRREVGTAESHGDVVSLSGLDRKEAYQKISYSLLDIILKRRS